MSILTCEEAAASLSSSNNMNNDTLCYPPHEHHLVTPQYQNPPQQIKKKRNQPGNPDPEAEVIALSPKTLLATNRFFCEICNKGFQRDQNLQLHRRGHNLPWKLKKRENKELVRKKVYVCPESSCVHHDPSRALGDLTGIKKHFSRKHGEKKWKCEKCSKRYAVQSDCKAHFKICGTREYKCECGTIFSRRDSFITHRAFCETLAVENSRSANPTIFSSQMNLQYFNRHHGHLPAATLFSTKKEQQPISNDHFRHIEIPPWLMMTTNSQPFQLGAVNIPGPPSVHNNFNSSSIFPANQQYTQSGHKDLNLHHHNPNPNIRGPTSSRGESGAVHISASALLLQKSADQFGATTISNKASTSAVTGRGSANLPHNTHESVTSTDSAAKQTAQNLSSREELMTTTSGPANISGMMTSFSNFANGFEDALLFGGLSNLNSKKEEDDDDYQQLYFNNLNEEDHMTKDFLGLRTLSHTDDIFNNIAALVNTQPHQFKNHKTWQT